MRPLTLDDLLPLEEFAARRREFQETLQRYLGQYRRVRVGPRLTLVFENRQTLWYRVHEVLRVARLAEPARVQRELDLYNRLLPGRDGLQAALLIEVVDETKLEEELEPWRALRGQDLCLVIGASVYPADLVTSRPEDRCVGTSHWVRFAVDAPGRKLLADLRRPARFDVTLPEYMHASPPLSDEVRQSLVADLEMSDKDQAA
jgi:hypothetical protein